MAKPEEYLVGIDIGSSKTGVLIGRPDEQGRIEIVGRGQSPNRGTRKGNIVNVEAAVDSLKQATEEAEVMAGTEVSRAYVGVAGVDMRSFNSRGVVSVSKKDRGICKQDVARVLEAARTPELPSDREILHGIPQEFIVDDQGGIQEPQGMMGSRLEVSIHLVTGHQTRSKTLTTCVNRAGIEVAGMVFEALATAEAVLTADERELGVLMIDLGAGTTEYALFQEGEVQHSAVMPIGAGHFTNDLAMVLRTPFSEAEKIKLHDGCCLPGMVDEDEGITVPSVAGGTSRVIPKLQLCEILQPRAQEMFSLIREDLLKNGYEEHLRGGVVLTGGGSQLDGLLEMAEEIFDAGVRYGLPNGLGGLVDVISSPTWTTASGLLLFGQGHAMQATTGQGRGFSVRGMVGSIKEIFADLL